jgi:hypothetical protein
MSIQERKNARRYGENRPPSAEGDSSDEGLAELLAGDGGNETILGSFAT